MVGGLDAHLHTSAMTLPLMERLTFSRGNHVHQAPT